MPSPRRLAALLLVVPSLSSVGCSTIASTLGFSPPIHKLTAPAEAFRVANASPAPLPKELAKSVLPAYIIEPGDTLVVEPTELDTPIRLPGSQPVLPDGTIDLGRYGRPVVAGKTVPEIEAEARKLIDAQIARDAKDAKEPKDAAKEPRERGPGTVNVRLVGRESKVFYVLGEVNSPRAYPLSGRETVLDGILVAGGITRQAEVTKIILSRPTKPEGCRVVLPVCYLNIVQLGDTSTNYQLQPGDRIYVPSQNPLDDFNLKALFGHKKKDECGPCKDPQANCGVPGGCGTGGPAGDVLSPPLPIQPSATPTPVAAPAPMPSAVPAPTPLGAPVGAGR